MAKINFMAFWDKLMGTPSQEDIIRRQKRDAANFGHKPTAEKGHGLRGRGYTKASHEESKARRKMAAKSRKINRK